MDGSLFGFLALIAFVFLTFFTLIYVASRYKRCPSDQILVIYGRVSKGRSSRTMHGGGAFVWPLIQDYAFLSLTPITISIPLENALSLQNIRIHVPSTFTVGISTVPEITSNAAERVLRLPQKAIEDMAQEIIFGQLRLTVASLTIEQINQDRESFLLSVRENVEPELNKIGLHLINVNITDITDESDYIRSIGKKAASEAINIAIVDVAENEKTGAIGKAAADREREIRVAEAEAEGEIGKKKADTNKRIQVQQQEASAVSGENEAKANIAEFDAKLEVKRAASLRQAEVAKFEAQVAIQKAFYNSEQERLRADEVLRQETEKLKLEIAAEAEAERTRRIAQGVADGILAKYKAEAQGMQLLLESKANGYRKLADSVDGDVQAAATLLMIEKLEELVARQVEAISNLKIDKITVWDSGGNGGGSSTSNFIANLFKSLPPLQEISDMAGFSFPDFLGKVQEKEIASAPSAASPASVKVEPVPPPVEPDPAQDSG